MAVRMTIFKPVYLDQRVSVSPTDLRSASSDIDKFLVDKIRSGLEGQCCTHGYVRPGSTQILARSMGQAEHCRFTGDFLFHCKVRVMCLLPEAGQIVDAQLLKVNKLGAYALVVDEGRVREAMRILLPKDLHLGNAEFEALAEGVIVRVRLLRSRFQSKDPFIQAVGVYEGVSATKLREAKKGPDVAAEEPEAVEGEAEVAASAVAP
jgi:DNA-directed RNA polymerase subunit E'/Rpb7